MVTEQPSDLAVPNASADSLQRLDIDTLREYRARLNEDEEKVSYWRRLIQMRLNLIKAEKGADHLATRDLVSALGSTGTGQRRQQLLSVDAQDELPQLPGLDDLWTAAIDPTDEAATALLVEELHRVERELSGYRSKLHDRHNAATAELIRRYKANPDLCLTLLPAPAR